MTPLRAAAELPTPPEKPDGGLDNITRLNEAGYKITEMGCTLFIDLDICIMLVFVDGKPLKAYPVSGGTDETPSPVGTWHVAEILRLGRGLRRQLDRPGRPVGYLRDSRHS